MIYLTFDSNIWIYLLDDSWKDYNPLDYLEHWISEDLVKILLPEIIVSEWDKHREEEKSRRIVKLKDFFTLAGEILPIGFIEDHRKPDNIEKIIDNQFSRIENLIKSKAHIIEPSIETKLKLIDWGIDKKAPMHRKTSMADAIIILSLFDFAYKNPSDEFIFISANTDDFYIKENGKHFIHPNLKDDFEKAKITGYTNLYTALANLKIKLPVTIDIEALKRDRIKYKIKEEVYNPAIIKSLENVQDIYLDNTKHLDYILKSSNPSKQQILFTLGLIESDESYKQYFFKNVDNPLWFNILKNNDVFHHKNNKNPIPVKEGFQVPFWEVLNYLEKVSLQIKDGKAPELTDELISVIKKVSEHPRDNFRTWYMFIKILANLPNEKITLEILNFIPTWLTCSFDTMLQTSEIIQNLLPKFLNENPSKQDIEKSELILKFLFEIEKVEKKQNELSSEDGSSYRSKVYLYFLSNFLIKDKLIQKIAQHCSNEVVLNLGRTLKNLLLDYPNGIKSIFKDGEKNYEINASLNNDTVIISSKLIFVENTEESVSSFFYENLTNAEIKEKVTEIINKQGINYQPTDNDNDIWEKINFGLNNDLYSAFLINPIGKLDDIYHHGDRIIDVFPLIFRDLLNEKAKLNSENAITLLRLFCFNNKYRLPFFKRITLFVIAENWENTKQLFWELVNNYDDHSFFSKLMYQKELYDLLKKNQQQLTTDEIEIISNIIEKGPQDEKDNTNDKYSEYWQLGWYSALKEIEPFKNKYNLFSKTLNITNEHYESIGEIKVRSGSLSPFSVEEILQMTNKEVVNQIKSFKQIDQWDGPTYDGFANVIGKAVETEPNKFSEEIVLFKDAYYIYVYRILNGFLEAWKTKKTFNWNNILNFCKIYIQDEAFYNGNLQLENDGWKVTPNWVVGSVANLLSEGMQNDKNAFEKDYLPIAKEILITLVQNLKPVEDFHSTNMDYPTYSLNSTAGKVIRALLDYSLRKARIYFNAEEASKWEPEMKALFESTLKIGILDGHIIEGMYFYQFNFLDKKWITKQIKQHYNIGEREWMAFFGGFAFGNPPFNKETYNLFYPHYEKAIENNIELKGYNSNGLIRHLVTFYFRNYEDLSEEKLLIKFLNTSTPDHISKFIQLIWQQKDYLKSVSVNEKQNFEKPVIELWEYISNKFQKPKDEEEQKILATLSNLIVFLPELDEKITNLILKSIQYIDKEFYTHYLLESLIILKNKGNPNNVAYLLGQIISAIPFHYYSIDFDKKDIVELVKFLYINNQKEMANTFCNRLSSQGHNFLTELYRNFNS